MGARLTLKLQTPLGNATMDTMRFNVKFLTTNALGLMAAAALAQGVPEQGFQIITTGTLGNCLACHALPGQRDVPSSFGPPFDRIGTRHDAASLRQWVTDARKIKPDTMMPPFGTTQGTNASVRAQSILSEEQIEHVVAALLSLR